MNLHHIFLYLLFLFCQIASFAQNETKKSGLWSDNANWTPAVPDSNQNATILHKMTMNIDIHVGGDTLCSYVFYSSLTDAIGDSSYSLYASKNAILDFWADSQIEGQLNLSIDAKLIIREGITLTVGGFHSIGNPSVILEKNARLLVLGTLTFETGDPGNIGPPANRPSTPTLLGKNFETYEDSTVLVNLKKFVLTNPRDSIRYSSDLKPKHGEASALNLKTGTFIYSPFSNYNGKDSVKYTVCASRNGLTTCTSGFLTIDVLPVNDPPEAISDTFVLDQGQKTITANLIKNDIDIDSDILKIVGSGVYKTKKGGDISIDHDGNIIYNIPPEFYGTDSMMYVIADAANVTDTAYAIFIVPAQMFISKGFSPNGDGKNDAWLIIPPSKSPSISVKIYNRWGDSVYESEDYRSNWDGEANRGMRLDNGSLPEGTYYYIVNFKDGSEINTGSLTLIR